MDFSSFEYPQNSETSNKALKAVNDANLVPFLVAFLQAHEHLPLSTVNAAGIFCSPDPNVMCVVDPLPAQCLYVLTEDNDPAIETLRSESSYVSTLLEIAKAEAPSISISEEGNKGTRWVTLRVLVSGERHSTLHVTALRCISCE
jgi:hypothetical protein